MKRKLFLGGTMMVIVFLLVSCDEFIGLLGISVPITIEESFPVGPIDSAETFNIQKNMQTELADFLNGEGVTPDMLSEIYVDSVILTIVSGADNFNAFNNFMLIISSDSIGTDTIASSGEIALGLEELKLEIANKNLLNYLELDGYSLSAFGTIRKQIEEEIIIKATVSCNADV